MKSRITRRRIGCGITINMSDPGGQIVWSMMLGNGSRWSEWWWRRGEEGGDGRQRCRRIGDVGEGFGLGVAFAVPGHALELEVDGVLSKTGVAGGGGETEGSF